MCTDCIRAYYGGAVLQAFIRIPAMAGRTHGARKSKRPSITRGLLLDCRRRHKQIFRQCEPHNSYKKLWHMGVRDQRVLMIIKAMLKAGIMGEISENPLGTPQGGIISPLLANVYLHSMDEWIAREWENKKTRTTYSSSRNQYSHYTDTQI